MNGIRIALTIAMALLFGISGVSQAEGPIFGGAVRYMGRRARPNAPRLLFHTYWLNACAPAAVNRIAPVRPRPIPAPVRPQPWPVPHRYAYSGEQGGVIVGRPTVSVVRRERPYYTGYGGSAPRAQEQVSVTAPRSFPFDPAADSVALEVTNEPAYGFCETTQVWVNE